MPQLIPTIENWSVDITPSNPGIIRLAGTVYGYGYFSMTQKVFTSPITKVEDGVVTTEEDIQYRLGKPATPFEAKRLKYIHLLAGKSFGDREAKHPS